MNANTRLKRLEQRLKERASTAPPIEAIVIYGPPKEPGGEPVLIHTSFLHPHPMAEVLWDGGRG